MVRQRDLGSLAGARRGLIIARRPGNALGRLLCLSAATSAACFLGREYLVDGLTGHAAPGWHWIGWLADSLFVVSMVALPMILMLLPDGRPISRAAARLLWLPPMALALSRTDFLLAPDALEVRGRPLVSPSSLQAPAALTDAASALGELLFFAAVVAGIATVIVRYRRSNHEVHGQLKWLMWSGVIALVELATEVHLEHLRQVTDRAQAIVRVWEAGLGTRKDPMAKA